MANIKKLIVALNKQIAFKAAASLGFMPADRKERMFIRAGVAVTWLPEGFPKPQSLSHYQDASAPKNLQPAALCFDTYRFRNTSEANDDYGRQYSYLKKLVLSEPTQIVCFFGREPGASYQFATFFHYVSTKGVLLKANYHSYSPNGLLDALNSTAPFNGSAHYPLLKSFEVVDQAVATNVIPLFSGLSEITDSHIMKMSFRRSTFWMLGYLEQNCRHADIKDAKGYRVCFVLSGDSKVMCEVDYLKLPPHLVKDDLITNKQSADAIAQYTSAQWSSLKIHSVNRVMSVDYPKPTMLNDVFGHFAHGPYDNPEFISTLVRLHMPQLSVITCPWIGIEDVVELSALQQERIARALCRSSLPSVRMKAAALFTADYEYHTSVSWKGVIIPTDVDYDHAFGSNYCRLVYEHIALKFISSMAQNDSELMEVVANLQIGNVFFKGRMASASKTLHLTEQQPEISVFAVNQNAHSSFLLLASQVMARAYEFTDDIRAAVFAELPAGLSYLVKTNMGHLEAKPTLVELISSSPKELTDPMHSEFWWSSLIKLDPTDDTANKLCYAHGQLVSKALAPMYQRLNQLIKLKEVVG